VHWGYEYFLGVHFWDYTGVFGNIRGRVCLPFTVAWGVLTALAVRFVHPGIAALAARVPPGVTYLFLLLLTVDAVCSVWALSETGDPESLQVNSDVMRKLAG